MKTYNPNQLNIGEFVTHKASNTRIRCYDYIEFENGTEDIENPIFKFANPDSKPFQLNLSEIIRESVLERTERTGATLFVAIA